ncbi:hypothetical protein [Leptospira venezuelensis]|uniref:hypothetical protein n=1 Tax=Leptospira venezuelensis TaxID=1958811 RepID=UPI003005DDFF
MDINLQNKNIGVSFAFWDILFGSLYIPKKGEAENIVFGLEEEEDSDFRNILKIYFLPFRKTLSQLKNMIRTLKQESKS